MEKRGITFVELLLVGTVLSSVSLFVGWNFRSTRQKFFLEKQAQELVGILEKARTDAMAAKEGRKFGVELKESQYIFFSLDDDANKAILKEKDLLPGMILTEDEVVFQKLTGIVDSEKIINLTNSPYLIKIEITRMAIKKGKIEIE